MTPVKAREYYFLPEAGVMTFHPYDNFDFDSLSAAELKQMFGFLKEQYPELFECYIVHDFCDEMYYVPDMFELLLREKFPTWTMKQLVVEWIPINYWDVFGGFNNVTA